MTRADDGRYGALAVVWEPFALAVVMGLLVSAAIYFIVMWPQVEPPDDLPAEAAEAAEVVVDAPVSTRDAGGAADGDRG